MKIALGIAACLVGCSAADAQVTAATYVGGGTIVNFGTATGWRFVPTAPVTVEQLGVWDENGDGLISPHNIGIFNRATLSPLAVAVVPAGTGAGLVDACRFVPITPVVLDAGVEYYLFSDNFLTDRYVFGAGSVVFNSSINWLGFTEGASGSIFSMPTFSTGQPGNLGPNMRMTVPAPGAVLVLSLLPAMVRRRR